MAYWYLDYKDVAVGADKATKFLPQPTDKYSRSAVDQLPYGFEKNKNYITLERNSWALDGTFEVMPDKFSEGEGIGYWSNTLSDATGEITTKQVIDVMFYPQGTSFSSTGILFDFSNNIGFHPANLHIKWMRNSETLSEKDFVVDSDNYFCKNLVENYDSLEIEFLRTSKPYLRTKLGKLTFGMQIIFEPDDVLSINIVQQLSPIATALPASKLNFEIDTGNKPNIQFLFQQKQPITVYLKNGEETETIGAYYITHSRQSALDRYSIEAEDDIGALDDYNFTPQMLTEAVNAKTKLLQILPREFQSHLTWDETLNDTTIQGYWQGKNLREAIQQFCVAIGALCYTANHSGLTFKKIADAEPVQISNESIYEGNTAETQEQVTDLNVYAHKYEEVSDQRAGDDIIKINDKYYKHTMTITTRQAANISITAKRKVMELKEATLINSDNVNAVVTRVWDYVKKCNRHQLQFVRRNGEKLGDIVKATTHLETEATGMLEEANILLSGIVAIKGSYKYG